MQTLPTPPQPHLDGGIKIRLLYEEVGGYVLDIVQKFLTSLPGHIQSLTNAMADKELPRIKSEAHKLKGSAASLGAVQMVHICSQLEQLCQTGQLPHTDLLTELAANVTVLSEIMPCIAQQIATPKKES